jgi:putrescine transport system permease protein
MGLVFIPAIGEYVIPALLGGPGAPLIGQVLWGEFFSNLDWPTAASVAVWLLAVLLGVPAAVVGVARLLADIRHFTRRASPPKLHGPSPRA